MDEKQMKNIGYPSIDKPWMKYYSEEALHGEIPKCTMYEYIFDHNKSHLDGIALRYFTKKITYQKLFENIRKTADAFWAQGIRKGDAVTIMSLNTPETIYCIYALNYIGAVANMVYMTLSEEEIVETVKNTDSKMFIFLDVAAEKVRNVVEDIEKIRVLAISPTDSLGFPVQKFSALKSKINTKGFWKWKDFLKAGEHQKAQQTSYHENELSVIVYTSGTTGTPKGVMLSNDSLNAVAWQYEKSGMKFTRGETFLTFMPPFLSIGLSLNVHLPLSLGLVSDMVIDPEPQNVTRMYLKKKTNHFTAAPMNIVQVFEQIKGNMQFCITMAGGGESLRTEQEAEINEELRKRHSEAKYLTGYGMTEFSATVTTSMNHVYKAGTLGIPLCKVNIKVINPDNGEMLKYNETGELCFCTPSHMLGYLDNEEETNQIFDRDSQNNLWLHTGDLGFVDEDGFVRFVGRMKRIYLAQAADGTLYKIFPQRIEETISEYPEVDMCAVVVELDAQNIATAIACVKRTAESQNNNNFLTGLQQYCKEKLPVHLVPKQIIELDEIPLTQSGKIDYKTLEKMTR